MSEALIETDRTEYFDQLSLAFIASFTSGVVSQNETFTELILTLLIVRAGLLVFYKLRRPHIDGEIRLIALTVIGWIVGASITRGHTWNADNDHLADMETRSFNQPQPKKPNLFISVIIGFLQNFM